MGNRLSAPARKVVNKVRFSSRLTLLAALLLSSLTVAVAQSSSADNLRSQLHDVQAKEEGLQARAKQLEEDLRPENIERFFALNGSTRPEELREQRRRQLERERDNVRSQLDQLAARRASLEAAIATADAAAYRQSALPTDSYNPSPTVSAGTTKTVKPKPARRRARRQRRARRRN